MNKNIIVNFVPPICDPCTVKKYFTQHFKILFLGKQYNTVPNQWYFIILSGM